jgi:hypothetical protein
MRSENKQSVDQILLQRQVEETIENINHICCFIAKEKMTAQKKVEVIGDLMMVNLELNQMLKMNGLEASMRN